VADDNEPRPWRDLAPDDRRPVPDPTVLTTQALYREVSALQELIEQSIRGTREVIDQQFYKVEQQFELIERQRVESKADARAALEAAFAASKEATNKSEESFTKQIDQLANSFADTQAAQQARVDELKERITDVDRKAEAPAQQKLGAKDDRTSFYSGVSVLVSVVFLLISFISLTVALTR